MKKAKHFQSKVAFEIPDSFEREDEQLGVLDIPNKLVDRLLALFDNCEFESSAICNPHLLIVNYHNTPTKERIQAAADRINRTLVKFAHDNP